MGFSAPGSGVEMYPSDLVLLERRTAGFWRSCRKSEHHELLATPDLTTKQRFKI